MTYNAENQKRDAAKRAADRAVRDARRLKPAVKAAVAAKVIESKPAAEWSVPVTAPRARGVK